MSHALKVLVIAGLVAVLPTPAMAEDDFITLDGARFRGGYEAPLVLYLMPWKPAEIRSLDRQDEDQMLTRSIKPLKRSEFRRLIRYHQRFQALSEAKTLMDYGVPRK